MPQSDLMDGIVAASMPFIIESGAIMPGCYLPLLGVLHLFTHLGIVTVSMGHGTDLGSFDNQVDIDKIKIRSLLRVYRYTQFLPNYKIR